MKTEQVARSVYASIIILIVTMAISGCIPFPTVIYSGANPGTIRAGSTSKAGIIKKFGYPDTKTFDGRFFIYDYSKRAGWCFTRVIEVEVEECFRDTPRKGWVFIEFDNDNIVEQHGVHVCRNPPGPLCDRPGIDAMWVMINQLAGEDVAAQYGQTLDEFRQAVALQNSLTESLRKAVELADPRAAKRLIDKGADINAEDRYGYTPLQVAASDGHIAIAKLLLSNGAAVTHQTQYRGTPLHEAALHGHVRMAELLLANGADVNARDYRGRTPLHRAAEIPHVTIIKLLLAKGASVNVRDANGGMPLHLAIGNGDTTVVQLLLSHGADANAKKRWFNNRPVKIARDLGGREYIIELLKQHGGKE